jgi:hypothetical protein
MQVVEHLLLEQVCFVEEESWMDFVCADVLDMVCNGIEDGGGSGFRIESKSKAELPIEVAPTEGGVVAVRQSKPRFGKSLADGPQHARLSDAGLTCQQDVAVLFAGVDDGVDDPLS